MTRPYDEMTCCGAGKGESSIAPRTAKMHSPGRQEDMLGSEETGPAAVTLDIGSLGRIERNSEDDLISGSSIYGLGSRWARSSTRGSKGTDPHARRWRILRSGDDDLLDLLAAAFRIRRRTFGNRVQLYFLMNAKSGLCPEDCGYCSQSKVSEAEIPRYNLLNAEKLLDGARVAAERQAKTYCIVISARGPSQREMDASRRSCPRSSSSTISRSAPAWAADARSGRAAESLRRRSRESQPQHQRAALRRDLLDPHLSGPRRHAARRARRRHGALLGRNHRHGRSRTPTWCEWPLPCANWTSNRFRSTSSIRSTARRWPGRSD